MSFLKSIKQAWLVRALPEKVRQRIGEIEQQFDDLRSEGRSHRDYLDCAYVLGTCQDWLDELETNQALDKLPLLQEIRDYMICFLPLYEAIMKEVTQKQPGFPRLSTGDD